MQTLFLEKGTSRRLITVFLGWAMDYRPFERLHRPGYDLVLVWDYSDSNLPCSDWLAYQEIVVIGWSMGVYFCTCLPDEIERKVTRRIAVNGTLTPMHDLTGIPENIFRGTLNGLCERSLEKFYMRVCGSREAYKDFSVSHPERDIRQLRSELACMTDLEDRCARFDVAIISLSDAIFPPENQQRAWKKVRMEIIPGNHLPDFQNILDIYVVDKDMVRQRFTKGTSTYESHAVVQREIVEEMVKHLSTATYKEVLEIGCGTGLLSRELFPLVTGRFEMWDICPAEPIPGTIVREVDAETAIKEEPPQSFDLIATASTIQWFNSPVSFLANAATVLRSGGLLAIGTYSKGNLDEITSLMPASLPLMSESEWLASIPPELVPVEVRGWTKVLEFDSAMDAFRHLKHTGVNSLGRGSVAGVSLCRLLALYKPAPSGKWQLTYRPIILILKKL